ncbi:MAG: 2-dehydropantoate 2-reductase [Acidobacteria bacterium]|jgi:2-dehydropantoate 2-reductase|nr:2-dehydropantoate 2-reductase [Acidobacteriota bacterium]
MKGEANKRVVILGGGAIGSVLAAALGQKQGQETILVGRREHVRAIRERGLKVDGMFAQPVQLDAREAIDLALDDTLIVVTVKAGDLQAALRAIVPLLRPTTVLLLLQNGHGIRELALEALRGTPARPENVFIGIVAMGVTFVAPGEVRCFGGNIRVEPAFAATPFFGLLQGLPIRVDASRDIRRDLWTKLLVNAVINPLSVVLQGHNRLVAEERFDPLKAPILAEGCSVAAAAGVSLKIDAAFVNRFVTSDNITSMLQDFRRGRPTEIDFINGAIAAAGKKHGIPTPANEYLVALIHALETLRKK